VYPVVLLLQSHMARAVHMEAINRLTVENIVGFIRRPVVPHGTGAKVTCPKEFLGSMVYLVITDQRWIPELPARR
jgi:putative transposon-encoded protein